MTDLPVPAPANLDQNQPADPTPADPDEPALNQPAPTGSAPNQPASMVPEFVGRPEEDVEAHLLCTNDWMLSHIFLDNVKVQRIY